MSFANSGYEVRPLFTQSEVQLLRQAVSAHMDRVAQALLKPCEETERGASFDERLELIASHDPSLAQLLGTAVATDAHRAPEVAALAHDDRLAEIASTLTDCTVGDRVFRFRLNSPALPGGRQLWHSDVSKVDGGSCSTVLVTAWIPLSDADCSTGGLEILPGKRSAPIPHSRVTGKMLISPRKLTGLETVTPEVPAGHALFLDRFTPHRAVAMTGQRTRWSLVVWLKNGQPTSARRSMRSTLAHNLKTVRKELGFSQEALADAAGLDRTYVSSLERERYAAGLDTIEQLANALKIEPGRLLLSDCVENQHY